MPIARRQSQNALPAQSGVHRAAEINFDDDELPASAPIPLAVGPAPKRYRSMEMAAVRPVTEATPPVGRMLDESLFEDPSPPIALALEAPPSGHGFTPSSTGQPLPAMWARSGSGQRPAAVRPLDPRPGIVAFAGYGLPPQNLSATPGYALRVWRRKLSLRSDLRIARMRNLPRRDIELYEAALACADEGAVTKGLLVVLASVAGALSAVAAASALLF